MNEKKFWSWESQLESSLQVIFAIIVAFGIVLGWVFKGFLTAVFFGIIAATIGVLIVGLNMVIIHIAQDVREMKNTMAKMDSSTVTPISTALSKAAAEKKQNDHNEAILKNGGWKCAKCGKANPTYTGTCSCGSSKYEQ